MRPEPVQGKEPSFFEFFKKMPEFGRTKLRVSCFCGVLLSVRIELNDDELKEILQLWKIEPKIPPNFAKAVWDRIAELERLRRKIPADAAFADPLTRPSAKSEGDRHTAKR